MQQTQTLELEDKGLQGLTSAQQAFARHVHSGLTYTEAYRLAFPNYKGVGLEQAAHALAKNVKVELKLRELRLSAEQQTSLAPGITREWVLKGFKEIAEDPTVKPSTRLAAYIAAGKTYAAPVFKEPEQSDAKPISTEDMDKRILELLRAGMATIDGVALDVTPTKEKAPAVKPGPAGVGRKRKPRA